jgi:23S rRNA pseudouridine955/2504/2580 synthase
MLQDAMQMAKEQKQSGARQVTVDASEADRRLDNFLLGRLKGVPRSRVYRMIRGGEVRVNKGRARPQTRLIKGDIVRIPPVYIGESEAGPHAAAAKWIENRIIYEDRDILVLDKPTGLAVHGGSGISHGAIELLRAARESSDDLELVHRLDRDTSGCLLVAKRRSSLRRLHEQFRGGTVKKCYAALLLGQWPGGERVCKEPLLTTGRRGGERHVRVSSAGKAAISRFIPEQRFRDATLTQVIILTGRTHQIRVHAAHLRHPVAGDQRYGPAEDLIIRRYGLRRLFLHATSLAFESPRDGQMIRVTAPLGGELQGVLKRLTNVQSAAEPDTTPSERTRQPD